MRRELRLYDWASPLLSLVMIMVITRKYNNAVKSFAKISAVVICCLLLIAFPKGASDGAALGLKYCGELLIPSLFPFMVISSYIVHSGISLKLSRVFSRITGVLFRLPGSAAPTVIMSFIGGFPVGARGIAGLFETGQISRNQAKRMSLFCIGAGPAFLITAIGTLLLKNSVLGVIILISQIVSGLILGIVSRFFYSDSAFDESRIENLKFSSKNAFVRSCSDGANGIISLSALVILFQAFIGVIGQSNFGNTIEKLLCGLGFGKFSQIILPSILEVTGACDKIVEGGFPLWILSAAVAFGGLCVHMQIWGILSEIGINKGLFLLFRLLNAVISGTITYLITIFYDPVNDVFSSFSERPLPNMSTHISGSMALLLLSMLFLLSISGKGKIGLAAKKSS